MAIQSVTRLVRNRIWERLAGVNPPILGFNACVVGFAELYGVDPYEINFDQDQSSVRNFFQSYVSADLLESASTVPKTNYLVLYGTGFRITNETKFRVFSGVVGMGVDVHLNHPNTGNFRVLEALADVTCDAMIRTMGDVELLDWSLSGVVYNHDLTCRRLPLVMGGQNVRQTITFSFTCEVHE